MKRLDTIFVVCLTAYAGALLAKEPLGWWAGQMGITEGELVNGSKSPDGKYGLFEFNFWAGKTPDSATTATGIGLAPVDRSQLLFVIDSRTKWMTDKKVTSFLTFLWSSDSSMLATHDSGDKHSKVSICRVSDGRVSSLDLPDLLAIACARLGVARTAVSASGQLPEKWLSKEVLLIAIHVVINGRKMTAKVPIHIDGNGTVSTQQP